MKIGRNQPCPCGSGRKYKRCHGDINLESRASSAEAARLLTRRQAEQRVRETQQGLGRPIVAGKLNEQQIVAVGNTLYWSKNWKTFPDFLCDYLKRKLGPEWGNLELLKDLSERHPILQWYDALCRYQAETIGSSGNVVNIEATGVTACYLSLSYGLYLLEHNVELQNRLIKRLKNIGNFQGAYYEVLVASNLIRSGFELEIEDETDSSSKHCEFSARSKISGKRYWIEAKMRAVSGQLGRTDADGTKSTNPLSGMIPHLNAALAKPAADERMIFIDLNAAMPADATESNPPPFAKFVTRRLTRFESTELKANEQSYVFITNMNFHRGLNISPQIMVIPFGLGLPDFNRPGHYRLSEHFEQQKKHQDAFRVAEGFSKFLVLPSTFDGSLPSSTLFGEAPPVQIGQNYVFEGVGENGGDLVGTVEQAIVLEPEQSVVVVVSCVDGQSYILRERMTDRQLLDYKAHPDAYFGKISDNNRQVKTPYELFEFFMDAYGSSTKDQILGFLNGAVPKAVDMDVNTLRSIYCEGLVAMSGMFPSGDRSV